MFDHSNCGIGAIANLDGTYSHNIIEQGMTVIVVEHQRTEQGMDAEFYCKSLKHFMVKSME